MDYDTLLHQVIALLQREQRLSYRVRKRRLQLDDEMLEDLKEDLVYAKQLAVDEEGKVLVWMGAAGAVTAPGSGATAPVKPPATTVGQDLRMGSPSPAPPTPEAERRQLTVLFCDLADSTALARQGVPLTATEGWGAPRMGHAYGRARELCQHVGDTAQLCSALIGLWAFYLARSEPKTAQELGEQLLRLAQSVQDPALLLEAHVALGNTLVWLGEFAPAHAHLEQGIALYNPQQHRSHILLYGHDPGAWCLGFAAWALWHLGYPDQAIQRSHEALTLAHGSSHPRILANALGYAAELHQLRREVQATQELAEAEMVLAREHGFMFFLAEATEVRPRLRILLITLAGSLFVAPQAAQTQPRGHLPRLGVLDPGPHQRPAPCLPAFPQGRRDLG
jgi:hypothetical protein